MHISRSSFLDNLHISIAIQIADNFLTSFTILIKSIWSYKIIPMARIDSVFRIHYFLVKGFSVLSKYWFIIKKLLSFPKKITIMHHILYQYHRRTVVASRKLKFEPFWLNLLACLLDRVAWAQYCTLFLNEMVEKRIRWIW